KVFDAPGKTKIQLFNSAQQWFIGRYKTDDGIEVLDTSNMRVIGKGKETVNFSSGLNASGPFRSLMSIQIDCKDGKYRCRLYSITLTNGNVHATNNLLDNLVINPESMVDLLTGKSGQSQLTKNQARGMLQALNATINNTIASLDKTMNDSF
ncbi:MAG: DUF4468 domain-containing protein, partial [Bacteroidetes bacterium]|nr:DUF4468 domain-containing protein [Bacteroidota bacterium]